MKLETRLCASLKDGIRNKCITRTVVSATGTSGSLQASLPLQWGDRKYYDYRCPRTRPPESSQSNRPLRLGAQNHHFMVASHNLVAGITTNYSCLAQLDCQNNHRYNCFLQIVYDNHHIFRCFVTTETSSLEYSLVGQFKSLVARGVQTGGEEEIWPRKGDLLSIASLMS